MWLLSRFLRVYLLGRLLGGRRRRGRAGFFGPFHTYSTRTRGGSRVTVSGCCLPVPFALAVSAALVARALLRG